MTNSRNVLHRRRFFTTTASFAVALAARGAVGSDEAEDERNHPKPGVPTIDADFPGGNVIVERIKGDKVTLRQDPRDTAGFWFYWYFRVRRAARRELAFHFTGGNVLGVRGPAVSTDGGRTWGWLGADAVEEASFTYAFPEDAGDVRFCLAMPYQAANLSEFLQRHQGNPHLKVERHSTTRKGRKTQRLRLGKLEGVPDHRVLLTCRHHSCEMMAGWALEGVMAAVLADTPDGRWFREHIELAVVPFMDKDGVEDGDQGKNRKPHDHNRDYEGKSIYPSVAALKAFVPKWSQGRLRVAMDLHCPYIRGGGDGPSSNERIFFVGNPSQEIWEHQQAISRILQGLQTGPLLHDPKHNLPWGQKWNTLKEPRSCSRWMALQPGVLVATTLEIPYANVGGQTVTVESARAFGHDLAGALRRFLEGNGP
ncbi:MAG: M14 family zinc carboxypeptidase [Planctomycetota bacterium]|jgi:hypothetical protein